MMVEILLFSAVLFSKSLDFEDIRRFTFFGDEKKGDSECVMPGGIIISYQKISELYFSVDGKEFFFLPVPITASGYINGVKVCEPDFPVEEINLRRRLKKRFESSDMYDKIKAEKQLLKDIFSQFSNKMWEGDFIFPVKDYKSIRWNFGMRRKINGYLSGYHKGIDISSRKGTKVFASNSGVVVLARRFTLEGNLIVIDHGNGVFSIYAHLWKFFVKEGDRVSKGELIGLVGSTGRSTAPHLHFGVKVSGVDVHPAIFFNISKIVSETTGLVGK